jgi:hypothetical protein
MAPVPDRAADRLLEAAGDSLAAGEAVLATAFTMIGPSLLICGWGGPLTAAMFRDGKHLLLTDRQLLIVNAARGSTAPVDVFAAIPRGRVSVVSAKSGRLGGVLRIDVAGQVLRIEFGRRWRDAFDTVSAALADAK